MKTALFLLLVLFLSCSTVPEEREFNYSPPVDIWLVYGEEFLCLVRRSLAVKEIETIKITASQRGDGGMRELAEKTRMKVDKEIRKEK